MIVVRLIGYFLVIIITFSCSSSTDEVKMPIDPTQLFNDQEELKHTRFEINGIDIAAPQQLLVVDTLLIINDRFEDENDTYFYGVFNRNSGLFYQVFGREGRGPDEFLANSYMFRAPEGFNNIIINNRRLFSVSEISLERVLSNSSRITVDQIDELNTSYSLVSKISDDLLFGTGTFTDGRFALADTSGELINTFLSYPFEDEFDGISTRDLGMAYQSNFSFHPTMPLVTVVNFTAGNLDILRVENDSIEEVSQVYTHQPKFENQSSETQISVMFDADNIMGYWDNDVTEEYIYALYSGRERSDPNQSTGNKLLVFDWEGNPIKQLNLDIEVSGIAVDQNNETLYAVANDDNNEAFIATFSLK